MSVSRSHPRPQGQADGAEPAHHLSRRHPPRLASAAAEVPRQGGGRRGAEQDVAEQRRHDHRPEPLPAGQTVKGLLTRASYVAYFAGHSLATRARVRRGYRRCFKKVLFEV